MARGEKPGPLQLVRYGCVQPRSVSEARGFTCASAGVAPEMRTKKHGKEAGAGAKVRGPTRTRAHRIAAPSGQMTRATAGAYAYIDDLWIVTSYFNPQRYRTKRRNYQLFVDKLKRAQLNWLVVECAFGNAPFELPRSASVLQFRARDVMWQKERLLNIAIQQLPDSCTKVAWVDCDIVFENPDWAVETSALLEKVPVVQPFAKAVRLPRGRLLHNAADMFFAGFCALRADRAQPDAERAKPPKASSLQLVYCRLCGSRVASSAVVCAGCRDRRHSGAGGNGAPKVASRRGLVADDFDRHGHTGFAWAARRELLLEHGLYDVGLAGTGDHLMAHAMCGEWESPCLPRLVGESGPQLSHFLGWGEPLHRAVLGNIDHVEGTVSHLWHGDDGDRQYKTRGWELADLSFDPGADLRLADSGCWEWNSDKPELHQWAIDYFDLRKEDGYALAARRPALIASPSA